MLAILTLIVPANLRAQKVDDTRAPANIAFYDERLFEGKDGLGRLRSAYDAAMSPAYISNRPADMEKSKAAYEMWKRILVDPILKEIRLSAERVASGNGFQIFELSSLDNAGQVLAINKEFDLSKLFIGYLNLPKEEQTRLPFVRVDGSRIGKVDTRSFFSLENGIKGWGAIPEDRFAEFCEVTKECANVGMFAEEYAVKHNLSLILDSSKTLPPSLQSVACEDITKEIIQRFNQYLREKPSLK